VPEIPFLEILAENLAARVSGRRIESIVIRQPALLQTASPAPESFAGEFLSLPTRVGKYIVLETESRRALVIHLMRSGRIQVQDLAQRAGLMKALSARVVLDDGTRLDLVEHGKEKKAKLWLTEDVADVPDLKRLGPDPSRGELEPEALAEALRTERRQLKSFLTDQRVMSGIGNGLSDEILHAAKLSPMKLSPTVTEAEVQALHAAILRVVAEQTEKLRLSAAGELPQKEPREHYAVHDHAGSPCPACGTTVARVSFADHDLFYCPGCQTGGKLLKDRRLSKLLK